MAKSIKIEAHAKINWSLDVVGKREDGYHLLKMLMQEIALADQLVLEESCEDRIYCDDHSLSNENNIAFKAWLKLKQGLGLKQCLDIRIIKKIPKAGGLAGGSADAAAVLKGANQLFSLGLDGIYLREMGLSLGADIPFCLLGGAALAEGIGEVLTPLTGIQSQEIVIANPGIEVPTVEIFKSFSLNDIVEHPYTEELLVALRSGDKKKIGALMSNLLEKVTLEKYPLVKELKDDLRKLGLYSLMSGSGASVFALSESREEAEQAVQSLKGKWPFITSTHTI